jgi:glycosyltransferase involved in cell wall biosynthesis
MEPVQDHFLLTLLLVKLIILPMDKKTLVIIPAYNEEESIEEVVEPFLDTACPYDYVIVNDGSTDRTTEICSARGFHSLQLKIRVGLPYAIKAGMRYALEHGYSYAAQFDGDGQHDIQYLPLLLKPLEENSCDIAIGSRFLARRTKFSMRSFGSAILSIAVRLCSGQKLTDPTSGMRMFNRSMIELYSSTPNIYPEPDTIGYLIRCGVRVLEVPITMHDRIGGKSMFSLGASISYMVKTALSLIFVQWFRRKEYDR